jgi:hypothetical protein
LLQQRVIQIFRAGVVVLLLVLAGFAGRGGNSELSLIPLYALPIGLAVWFFGVWVGLAIAGIAALTSAWTDVGASPIYPEPAMVYLTAGSRLIFFLVIVLAVEYGARTLRRKRGRWPFHSPAFQVCAECGKVRNQDGYWESADGRPLETRDPMAHAKLCPDCARKAYAASGEPNSSIQH